MTLHPIAMQQDSADKGISTDNIHCNKIIILIQIITHHWLSMNSDFLLLADIE